MHLNPLLKIIDEWTCPNTWMQHPSLPLFLNKGVINCLRRKRKQHNYSLSHHVKRCEQKYQNNIILLSWRSMMEIAQYIYIWSKYSSSHEKEQPTTLFDGRSNNQVHYSPFPFFFHLLFLLPFGLCVSVFFFIFNMKFLIRHAVVTGANEGIGFEIVRQLASMESLWP